MYMWISLFGATFRVRGTVLGLLIVRIIIVWIMENYHTVFHDCTSLNNYQYHLEVDLK